MTCRSIAGKLITYFGIGIIGLLAIPTGLLVGIIYLIWSSVDYAISKLK